MTGRVGQLERAVSHASRPVLRSRKGRSEGAEDLVRIRRLCNLYQIRALLRMGGKAARHPLAVGELAFDRLLLAYSSHYRRTRELAYTLGVRLQPQVQSALRANETFDPADRTLSYSPIESELRWLLERPLLDGKALPRLIMLREEMRSIYHDLQHMIFFQLARPPRLACDRRLVRSYFAWVESLVFVRDIQIAEEMGCAGQPMRTMAALYAALPSQPAKYRGRLTFEKFRALQAYSYFENMGFDDEAIFRAHQRAGLPVCDHPLRKTNGVFLETTSPKWLRAYCARYGARIRLPRRPETRFPFLRLTPQPPERWISDEPSIRKTYTWFKTLFPG